MQAFMRNHVQSLASSKNIQQLLLQFPTATGSYTSPTANKQTNKQTKNPANQPNQTKPKNHFTDLQNLALQVFDLVVRTPELGLLGHDLQTQVGALTLQLVGRGLVLLRLLRQLAVLLQQV